VETLDAFREAYLSLDEKQQKALADEPTVTSVLVELDKKAEGRQGKSVGKHLKAAEPWIKASSLLLTFAALPASLNPIAGLVVNCVKGVLSVS
jgi:hypothetical protein